MYSGFFFFLFSFYSRSPESVLSCARAHCKDAADEGEGEERARARLKSDEAVPDLQTCLGLSLIGV